MSWLTLQSLAAFYEWKWLLGNSCVQYFVIAFWPVWHFRPNANTMQSGMWFEPGIFTLQIMFATPRPQCWKLYHFKSCQATHYKLLPGMQELPNCVHQPWATDNNNIIVTNMKGQKTRQTGNNQQPSSPQRTLSDGPAAAVAAAAVACGGCPRPPSCAGSWPALAGLPASLASSPQPLPGAVRSEFTVTSKVKGYNYSSRLWQQVNALVNIQGYAHSSRLLSQPQSISTCKILQINIQVNILRYRYLQHTYVNHGSFCKCHRR